MITLKVRYSRESDKPFILSTWLRSFKKLSDFTRHMHRPLYFQHHHEVVERIWARPTTLTLVAHDPEDDNVIMGYVATEQRTDVERPIVHYVYVKEPFQNLGVANYLFEASGFNLNRLFLTHLTRDRLDQNPDSPTFGQLKWRGGDTLLESHPLAKELHILQRGNRRKVEYVDGNLYAGPYLW